MAQAIADRIKHSRFTAIPACIYLAKIRLGLNGATRHILGFFINLNVDFARPKKSSVSNQASLRHLGTRSSGP
jgi:hypothetical protein